MATLDGLTGLLIRDRQVVPTAERFRLDFGSRSPAYLDGMRRMRRAWGLVGGGGEARVAFEAWRRYLRMTYGSLADSGEDEASDETVELFLKHTFLAMIARLLTWASLSKGEAPGGFRPAIEGAIDGSFFRRRRIENLVESDFFQWAVEPRAADALMPAWERSVALMLTYDLSRLSEDVLKGVYQELVDPKDRHDLGEHYTPEWLCERIVTEMMPETGVVSVLDPTCGSGSFLRAAIAHLVEHNEGMDRGELLAAILDGVVGIDIHPLAAAIARATYVLAIGELLTESCTIVNIPVYLADALAGPARGREGSIGAFARLDEHRPAPPRDRFDLILGNPPWLSYRYISDPEYQAEVKRRAVEEYEIAPKEQKLFTQMELATVFLIHALATFGREGGRLAFVMPRSVMTADQHDRLRRREYSAPVAVTELWDLFDVRPLFNVPSCVLFARRIGEGESKAPKRALRALVWEGQLGARNLDWERASGRLTYKRRTAKVARLGRRSAWTTSKTAVDLGLPGAYLKAFRQGATIVPRNFYFVDLPEDRGRPIEPGRTYWAETEPEQAKEAKPPYKGIAFGGAIEGEFLFRTAIARNVLPFAVVDPPLVVLPVVVGEEGPRVRTARQLMDEGFRECGDWMELAEAHWKRHREKKAGRQSVYERLDYQRGLSGQDLSAPHVVLYNGDGKNVCAAVLARSGCPGVFFADTTLYWFATHRRSEADYLAAILNAPIVDALIKPFQSVGLGRERHVHKKVLELPIPLFDEGDASHVSLARLGAEAGRNAEEVIDGARADGWPKGLARRRAIVRSGLGDVLGRIDRAVKALFGVG